MHMKNSNSGLVNLLDTIKTLRGPDGCPWDIKQTPETLTKYLREEVFELIQAIDNKDSENICEEIGDVIYVLAMIAEIHAGRGDFVLEDCLSAINAKLIRRHPHVFSEKTVKTEAELREQWNSIKKQEKKQKI